MLCKEGERDTDKVNRHGCPLKIKVGIYVNEGFTVIIMLDLK